MKYRVTMVSPPIEADSEEQALAMARRFATSPHSENVWAVVPDAEFEHRDYAQLVDQQGEVKTCGCGWPITEYPLNGMTMRWMHIFNEELTGTDDHDPEPNVL